MAYHEIHRNDQYLQRKKLELADYLRVLNYLNDQGLSSFWESKKKLKTLAHLCNVDDIKKHLKNRLTLKIENYPLCYIQIRIKMRALMN